MEIEEEGKSTRKKSAVLSASKQSAKSRSLLGNRVSVSVSQKSTGIAAIPAS